MIKRKYRILIAMFSLLILLMIVDKTYAKYITAAKTETDITIAKWVIKINDQDITKDTPIENVIVPYYIPNPHIKDGVLAPTSRGYFDLTIDGSEADTSFTQTISMELAEKNTVTDLIIIGYSEDTTSLTPTVIFTEENQDIVKDFLITDTDRTKTYRVFVEWYDSTDELMNNQDDTEASKRGKAAINVSINCIQIKETL